MLTRAMALNPWTKEELDAMLVNRGFANISTSSLLVRRSRLRRNQWDDMSR
jgi:hypothetical protein